MRQRKRKRERERERESVGERERKRERENRIKEVSALALKVVFSQHESEVMSSYNAVHLHMQRQRDSG